VILATTLHAALLTTGTVTKKPVHAPTIDPALAAQLAAVEKLPTVEADTLPRGGTFYSAQCPYWPPLPGNVFGLPVWDLEDGHYLIDDLAVNYQNSTISVSTMTANGVMAMDVPLPGGGGDSTNTYSPQIQSSYTLPPGLKITPPIFTNGNVSVSIYEQDPSIPYDIYYCTNLIPPIQWNLVSHGIVGQTNYVFANSFGGSPTVFYIVGSGADTVGQGLSDGFIALVLHLNPFASSADGMTIGWKYLHGLNPAITYTNYVPPATTLTITKPSNRAVIQ
jgi:hypothetical protein